MMRDDVPSTHPPDLPDPTAAARVAVVTGATSGIGKATAFELARRGLHVVLVARDAARGAATVEELRAATGARASMVIADFASLRSVREGAEKLARRHEAIHVLVNNAGVSLARRQVSADGHELTLAVNHLAPFLFTTLLLPLLADGAPARVVNVTSRFERMGRIHLDDLDLTRGWTGFKAYAQSKLANVLFTYALAERVATRGIVVNCAHPGLVATSLLRDRPAWMRRLWDPFLLSPQQGAETPVFLATAAAVEGVTGQYFERCRPRRSSARSYDRDLGERLWAATETMIAAATDLGSTTA